MTTDIAQLIVAGCRVAVEDGVGSPHSVYGPLSAAAEAAGDVELVVGWTPLLDPKLRFESFADVRTLMTAVNQAVDRRQGQVNAEGSTESRIGAVGGNPDFAAAGARSLNGLSIIAVPSHHRGRPTLVDRLSMPVTVPGHDVDIVITEHGAADLRGLDRAERARAIRALWK